MAVSHMDVKAVHCPKAPIWGMSETVVLHSPTSPRLAVALPVDPIEPQVTDSVALPFVLGQRQPNSPMAQTCLIQTRRPRGHTTSPLNIVQDHRPPHIPHPYLFLLYFSFYPILVHTIDLHDFPSELALCQDPGVWG